jgi:ABC-type multidrug transport system ATPase subunit
VIRNQQFACAAKLVVNMMGTNGAGKSTLVRNILEEAKRANPDWYEWYQDGRERPPVRAGPLQRALRGVRHLADG